MKTTIFNKKALAFFGAAALLLAAVFTIGCKTETSSDSEAETPPVQKFAVTFSVDGGNGKLKAKAEGVTETATSPINVEKGKSVTFTATPDSGFHVKGWTLDGKAVNGTNSSYSFPVTKAAEVKVSFESNSTPLPQYAVTFSVEGGNGTLKAKADGVAETEASPINVEKGKTVTFTAFPAAGYEVKEWQIFGAGMVFEAGTGTAGNNTAQVNLKGNLTVKVSFKIQTLTPKHLVTMSAGANGSISAEPALPAGGMVNENTTIVFTASPDSASYTVDAWTITGGQLLAGGQAGSSRAMVKITEPVTVAVSFKLKPPTTYTVIFGVDGTPPNGTISATYKADGTAFTSGTAVAENIVLVFTASPDTGYKVEKWTVNGTAVPGNTSNTYEHTVTEAATIQVSFISSVEIPGNFTLANGAEYKVTDKEQKHVIMTKRENDPVGTVYTVAVTVEYSGITYTLTGFSGFCISRFGHVTSLTAFALSGESAFLSVDGGVLFNKAKTKLIHYPSGKDGTSYTVPDGITVLGAYSFYYSKKLTSVVLPTGLTTIEEYALSACDNLQTVNLPSTLTSIEMGLLSYCNKVEHVVLPEGITELPRDTLYQCNGLKTVEVPSTLLTTGWAFCYECTALQSVTCKRATPPALGDYAFKGVTLSGVTLKVPAASVSAYEGAAVWKNFKKPFVALP